MKDLKLIAQMIKESWEADRKGMIRDGLAVLILVPTLYAFIYIASL